MLKVQIIMAAPPRSQKTVHCPILVEPRVIQDPYGEAGFFKRNLGPGKGEPWEGFPWGRGWALTRSHRLCADDSVKEAGHKHCGSQLNVGQRTLSRRPVWMTGRTKDPGLQSPHGSIWKGSGQADDQVSQGAFWLITTSDSCPPLPQVVDGIEVYSTKISCKVTSRFAHNVVTTRAVNRADKAKEVSFDVELPKTAFITNFTLWVPRELLALSPEGHLARCASPFP